MLISCMEGCAMSGGEGREKEGEERGEGGREREREVRLVFTLNVSGFFIVYYK